MGVLRSLESIKGEINERGGAKEALLSQKREGDLGFGFRRRGPRRTV